MKPKKPARSKTPTTKAKGAKQKPTTRASREAHAKASKDEEE